MLPGKQDAVMVRNGASPDFVQCSGRSGAYIPDFHQINYF